MIAIGTEQPRVLVVDDEKFIRDILADFLTMEGYSVSTAEDGSQALDELSRRNFSLIISDLKMPRMGGLDLLQHITRLQPEALTVIMTGFGTVETAIDAMKQGAYDYILKPFKVEEILHIVERGLEKQRLATENLRLQEAVSLYKVSEAITASLSLDDVVHTVVDGALREIAADAVHIWLGDGSGGYFERARYTHGELDRSQPKPGLAISASKRPSKPPSRPPSEYPPLSQATKQTSACAGRLDPDVISHRLTQDRPLILHGDDGKALFAEQPAEAVQSTMTVPLRMQGKLLGWISVVSVTPSRRFTEGQRKLMSIVASRAAAAIENARLYEDLQATFQQTIQSLANTIDKMDRYTAGHSQRVALYAQRLARWHGLDEGEVEVVRQAALMHDIGKVGCVMNLNKPGKLTSEEYQTFQRHPDYGKEILDPIAFLGPVIPGVHLHHERWDGRGYPLGLAGSKIPLIARIISVADTYDAMTSDRAYRKALPHEVAMGEIERCSGSQFDPDVSHLFCSHMDDFREEQAADGVAIPE